VGRVIDADAASQALLGAHVCGELLALQVEHASAAKCERFVQRAGREGAFGWELNVHTAQGPLLLLFAGLPDGDSRLSILAAETPVALLGLLDRQHTSTAPHAHADLAASREPAQAPPSVFSPLDELTRVNSDLVSLQRELAKRNAELAAVTRQRNELLAVAAHDLRNPLLVVQGYCDLLGVASDLTPNSQRELVDRVQHASELMLHVVEETLEYTRLEAHTAPQHVADIDLAKVACECAEGYRQLAERKHIELLVHCSTKLPRLQLDPTHVEQIVGNLLSNAIKYSDAGSEIELALSRRGAYAFLAVADHGQGIAEAEVPLLFRPFQTTSARPTAGEPSTGLGLAIVRKLVEANGGEISVQSCLQRGSTFTVKFPIGRASSVELKNGASDAVGAHPAAVLARTKRGQS
jgi:signal transduction histidine kinase